ncbi:hypothetical protein GCM10009616_11960 [Microlunatus lacustris]
MLCKSRIGLWLVSPSRGAGPLDGMIMQRGGMVQRSGDEQSPAVGADLALEAVSCALDVPASTIRSWEERHQLLTGRTREGGQGRYTSDDVTALARMRDELAAGRDAEETAALVRAALTNPPGQVVARLLAATHQLHTQGIVEALQESRRTHGLVVTLEQVVLPALQEIGRQWTAGTCNMVHEYLLASAIQSWLGAQRHQMDRPGSRGTVVLACGPDDKHAVALEAFAVLLADQGYNCRYLGAQTPVASLVLAAQEPAARAVVVVSHVDRHRGAAVAALHAVAALDVAVFYAGAAFRNPEQRQDVPGCYLGGSLSAAARQLIDCTDAPD